MSQNWFYAKGQQQIGPVPEDALRAMIASGQVLPSDLVWAEGMPNWIEAERIPHLFAIESGSLAASNTPRSAPEIAYRRTDPATRPPKNYIIPAILVTCFCCMPFGIVSLVYASQVEGKWYTGDSQGAFKSSRLARIWAWWAFGCSAGIFVLWLVLAIVGAAM